MLGALVCPIAQLPIPNIVLVNIVLTFVCVGKHGKNGTKTGAPTISSQELSILQTTPNALCLHPELQRKTTSTWSILAVKYKPRKLSHGIGKLQLMLH